MEKPKGSCWNCGKSKFCTIRGQHPFLKCKFCGATTVGLLPEVRREE